MSEEIKVGDVVRVSELPKIYERIGSRIVQDYKCRVVKIDDGMALLDSIPAKHTFLFPTKYLTKVEDEAKEPKFKVGDVVRMKDGYYKEELCGCIGVIRKIDGCHIYVEIDSTIYPATTHSIEPYTEPTAPTIKVGDVIDTPKGKGSVRISYGDYWVVQLDNGEWYIHMETNMPYAPDTEPTEQTEAEKTDTDNIVDDFTKVMEDYRKVFADIADNFDWQRYEADLAKEIALKVANKYSDPKEAAEYAVSVAKAVVENLKKK